MKTIRLDVDDSIFDKVMYFLNHLPKEDVRVNVEKAQSEHKQRKLTTLSIETKGFKFDREVAHAR